MSMNCADYSDLILRLPDADLTPDEAVLLRQHLKVCPNCRRVFRAVENVANDLLETEEPPAILAENVMSRIRFHGVKEEAVNVRSNANKGQKVRKKHARRRFGKVLAIAACFAIILGGGGYLATRLLGAIDAANSAKSEAVVLEEPHTLMNAAAEIPAPEAAEAEFAADAGGADFAPAEEADSTQAAVRHPEYTWEHPALVPEGREADFEALIQDAGWPDGVPQTDWKVFAAVEYQGVIYEFLTDPAEEYLLWRDAAETVVAIHSPGTVDALWAVID